MIFEDECQGTKRLSEARRASEKAAIFTKARELAAQDKPSQDAVRKLAKAIKKATWMWSSEYKPVQSELVKLGLMSHDGFFTGIW